MLLMIRLDVSSINWSFSNRHHNQYNIQVHKSRWGLTWSDDLLQRVQTKTQMKLQWSEIKDKTKEQHPLAPGSA